MLSSQCIKVPLRGLFMHLIEISVSKFIEFNMIHFSQTTFYNELQDYRVSTYETPQLGTIS